MTMLSDSELSDNLLKILDDAQKGDQAAWGELFRECYPKIRRVVRRKLNNSMRSLYDSTDFASDVMKSFAAKLDHLNFVSIQSLIAFLADVAEKKVIDEYRRRHTRKWDVDRERPLSTDPESAPVQLASGDPTPSQFCQAKEVHEFLLDRQDETERTIIDLKRLGYSNGDISERTGWNIRKVQRFLKNLRESLVDPGA